MIKTIFAITIPQKSLTRISPFSLDGAYHLQLCRISPHPYSAQDAGKTYGGKSHVTDRMDIDFVRRFTDYYHFCHRSLLYHAPAIWYRSNKTLRIPIPVC